MKKITLFEGEIIGRGSGLKGDTVLFDTEDGMVELPISKNTAHLIFTKKAKIVMEVL